MTFGDESRTFGKRKFPGKPLSNPWNEGVHLPRYVLNFVSILLNSEKKINGTFDENWCTYVTKRLQRFSLGEPKFR